MDTFTSYMVLWRSQNIITDFLMILAWANPFIIIIKKMTKTAILSVTCRLLHTGTRSAACGKVFLLRICCCSAQQSIIQFTIQYWIILCWAEQQHIRNKNSFPQAALRVPVLIHMRDVVREWMIQQAIPAWEVVALTTTPRVLCVGYTLLYSNAADMSKKMKWN